MRHLGFTANRSPSADLARAAALLIQNSCSGMRLAKMEAVLTNPHGLMQFVAFTQQAGTTEAALKEGRETFMA